jgi:hypothetical protein
VGLKVLADLILRPARSRRYFTNSTWSGASPRSLWWRNSRFAWIFAPQAGKEGWEDRAAVVPYVLALVAVVVSVDVIFFRNRLWERLMMNVGIVLVFWARSIGGS